MAAVLYAVVAEGARPLAEHCEPGTVDAASLVPSALDQLQRLPRNQSQGSVVLEQDGVPRYKKKHLFFLRQDNFTFACVTERGFGQARAMQFLGEVAAEFEPFKQAARRYNNYELDDRFARIIAGLIPRAPTNDPELLQAQQEVSAATGVMRDTLQKVVQRDELLEDLQGRSEDISADSARFQTRSTKLRRRAAWSAYKYYLIPVVVIVVLAGIIALSICSKPGKCTRSRSSLKQCSDIPAQKCNPSLQVFGHKACGDDSKVICGPSASTVNQFFSRDGKKCNAANSRLTKCYVKRAAELDALFPDNEFSHTNCTDTCTNVLLRQATRLHDSKACELSKDASLQALFLRDARAQTLCQRSHHVYCGDLLYDTILPLRETTPTKHNCSTISRGGTCFAHVQERWDDLKLNVTLTAEFFASINNTCTSFGITLQTSSSFLSAASAVTVIVMALTSILLTH
ncbi:hypothetical protein PTSG_09110 [Salpingoeca rosetta]|uniref:V-SNARE coiled-coil homology domain-containing protein n=1 Tax=Salpingoeca rosetta (strain ATCC 50818 / BSB-021) TaxID=946362 RepID=F2UMR5_SALR5|nr:uncharacterized protein PTSG_09110 [Salpingoeca rosetta]EGD78414.1 hypothetical protein PTSG_09110 [Salpingoeca rosetta]|eukprot:XP_004989363.1 hypothetical protein PTSG_09110 [Salpingoeca rosetta]